MKILGVNALNHDAAVCVIENGHILYAAHAERFSRIKNDFYLNQEMVGEALSFGPIDQVAYYEKPYVKKVRQVIAGQWNQVFSPNTIPRNHLKKFGIPTQNLVYVDHHLSHAAAGYYTSPFNEAAIVCIDAIGEWTTLSIWKAINNVLQQIGNIDYPHSLGIFYSAFTQRCGFKPAEEEYIMMGMAAYGEPIYVNRIWDDFICDDNGLFKLKIDCHRGIGNYLPAARVEDLAASAQLVTEKVIENVMRYARDKTQCTNLVYGGGVALNCVANRLLPKYFSNIWILPNPGDAGSSLGCAAYVYGKHIDWRNPFLGHEIKGEFPVKNILNDLTQGKIVGVANGRAELGPRALGNRSLLADPRGGEIKDRTNAIKRRQKFRPFAPAILEEFANDYFEFPMKKSPYMQYTARCRYPGEFPAITHVDGTSRLQTVTTRDNPGLYTLLQEFYTKTGCPMLLNTSLNIKGEPLVNNEGHAKRFESNHNVPVYS